MTCFYIPTLEPQVEHRFNQMGDFIFNSKTIIKTYLLLEEWQMIFWTPHTDLFKKKQKKPQTSTWSAVSDVTHKW